MRLQCDQEAANGFRVAARRFGELADDFPGKRPLYLQSQAMNHNNGGMALVALGKQDEAAQSCARSLEILERLIADDPGNASLHRDLATSQANLASIEHPEGNGTAGRNRLDSVLATQEKLVEQFPQVPQYRHALALYRGAIALLEVLVETSPVEATYRQHFHGACMNLATILMATNRKSEAEEFARKADQLKLDN